MNILYDHEIFTKQRYGGISRYFYEIIVRIAQFDNGAVDLFMGLNNSGYNFKEYERYLHLYKSHKIKNIDKAYIFFLGLNNLLYKRFAANTGFDILHKTYYSSLGLDFKCNKVITIHDMTHEIYSKSFSSGDNTSKSKKKCVEQADGIICVSHITKRDLINIYKVSEDKISVIHHGNSLRLKVVNARIIDQPYIMHVGQRWGYKNFDMLLSAYSLFPELHNNFKLVCFGGGDFNYSERSYILSKRLMNKVIHISGGDIILANLYNYASLLVYPSLYEGFGFPPLEAMYYGCPVVASEFSSIPEVVGDAGLYFNPHDVEELLYKVMLIIEDTKLREAFVQKGFEREKKFSWNLSAQKTWNFYKQFSN